MQKGEKHNNTTQQIVQIKKYTITITIKIKNTYTYTYTDARTIQEEEVALIDALYVVIVLCFMVMCKEFPQQLLHKHIIMSANIEIIPCHIRGQIEKVKDTNLNKIFELLIRSTRIHGQSIKRRRNTTAVVIHICTYVCTSTICDL